MPSSDYGNAVGGGLKLKGGKVDKKKKKKSSKPAGDSTALTSTSSKPEGETKEAEGEQTALQKALADEESQDQLQKADVDEVKEFGKTEAQRRFEERKRKRLDERLKKEGVQTHKERVQQLNKYLSTLSEHNDMPRIGPG